MGCFGSKNEANNQVADAARTEPLRNHSKQDQSKVSSIHANRQYAQNPSLNRLQTLESNFGAYSPSIATPDVQPPPPIGTAPEDFSFLAIQNNASPRRYTIDEALATLVAYGFETSLAARTLEITNNDVDFALAILLDSAGDQMNQQPEKQKPKIRSSKHKFKSRKKPDKTLLSQSKSFEQSLVMPNADEKDYELLFEPPTYGFEIVKGANKNTAIVGERTNAFAKENLLPGSLVVAVDRTVFIGMPLKELRQFMVETMKVKPMVCIRFRTKIKKLKAFKLEGTLRIMVVGAGELRSSATHCSIEVGQVILKTDEVKACRNPIWNSNIVFENFRPAIMNKIYIHVWRSSKLSGSSKLGTGVFPPTTDLDKLHNHVVEITDNSNNIVGVMAIKQMLQKYHHGKKL